MLFRRSVIWFLEEEMSFSRRSFLTAAVLGSLSLGLDAETDRSAGQESRAGNRETAPPLPRPVIISANNGFNYLDDAYAYLSQGGDTLEAALRVVTGPENDPNDDSVGLGGLPNEDGIVELDACCMHGPTRRAGAVGGVRNIKNVSLVSKAVMEHTGHVMLVGEGAERFAVAAGFPRESLLTEHSRKIWFLWKQFHSTNDWWGPGPSDPHWQPPEGKPTAKTQAELWPARLRRLEQMAADAGIDPEFRHEAICRVLFPPTGTIHCSALNAKGEMSGCTSTSGLAFKLPGRVGDSPIIGAGCYTDQDVGSAGATGSGEENIRVVGAHTIIENMRRGMSPQEAGMDALNRIVRNYNHDMNKLKLVDMTYYILRKDGAYAGVSLWEGYSPDRPHKIAIHDGSKRVEKTVSLLKGNSTKFPSFPQILEEPKKQSEYMK
jgi:N4-(beta-N-acetylglucosaminyl)-L-asparaginase